MRILVLLLLVGCGTYQFNRAALVPRAAPRMSTGQPQTATGQLGLGATSVTTLGQPTAGDPNAGIEVPSTQLQGNLKMRANENVSFGLIYENGLSAGAEPLKDTQPRVEGGSVYGYGFSLDISIPTGNPAFRVGAGIDAMIWSTPYVEYATCAFGEACFPGTIMQRGRDSVGTIAVSMIPSYKISPEVALFGGVTVRQHPTLEQKGLETDPLFTSPEVDSGPFNYIVSGGAELSLADGAILASGVVYWDMSQTPAKYKPGIGVMVSLPLGRRGPPKPATPGPVFMVPVATPPPPYPPGPYPSPAPYPPPSPYVPAPAPVPPAPYPPPPPL
jgi:hypothetical protein